jgi:cysteine-rich repeat protein
MVAVANHGTVVLTGTLVGRANDTFGSCGGSGPDVAYAVTPAANGSLTYRLSTLFSASVIARDGCSGTPAELGCDDVDNAGVVQNSIMVTAGTTYYLWVDSTFGDTGSYALQLSLNAGCGNRRIGGNESCDDGNTTNGDGCAANCQVESGTSSDACPGGTSAGLALGNGPVWLAGDTSGLAGDLTSTCVSSGSNDAVFTITPTVSGTLRATVYPGGDWNTQLYVRTDCTAASEIACANNAPSRGLETVTAPVTAGTRYFVIVDGVASFTTASTGPFRLSLEIPRCGDGVLQTGEQCDDGNATAGDGCDAACAVEAACRADEAEPNPYNAPNTAPSTCAQSNVFAAIVPANDTDFFTLDLAAGQIVSARTFVGSPTDCAPGVDTVLEVFRGPIGAAPTNSSCGTSGAFVCNDDIYAGDLCSQFSFPVPIGGQYVLRAFTYGFGATVANYGIYVDVR